MVKSTANRQQYCRTRKALGTETSFSTAQSRRGDQGRSHGTYPSAVRAGQEGVARRANPVLGSDPGASTPSMVWEGDRSVPCRIGAIRACRDRGVPCSGVAQQARGTLLVRCTARAGADRLRRTTPCRESCRASVVDSWVDKQ
eukprot:366301-Chlamydomonas_euryale.AAC.40